MIRSEKKFVCHKNALGHVCLTVTYMSVNCFSKKGNASVINARETAPINSTETMYEKVHNSSKYGKLTGKNIPLDLFHDI